MSLIFLRAKPYPAGGGGWGALEVMKVVTSILKELSRVKGGGDTSISRSELSTVFLFS
jgi:hypothetical protein